ncbi:unnamed protein product [Prunus armeniaca]|uniref:Uncharacterized protein n=1 Tax=Prunus armeniaca TaxID=36596 RepID=A0A6J5VTV6_PRUAR|nr:unnamed protein product [Prunus armeniaca]CAB4321353.1 unnamed protein product [Prunus armeniaca]
MASGFSILWKEQGPSSLWRGWSGKLFGYGVQGGCRFGLYEYFKKLYSDVLKDHNRSTIFFLSSASAQVFADVALCPFEAVKVRVQTQPYFAKGLVDGFPKLYATEGLAGFYKGLFPLWGRNLPCNISIPAFLKFSFACLVGSKATDNAVLSAMIGNMKSGIVLHLFRTGKHKGATCVVPDPRISYMLSGIYHEKVAIFSMIMFTTFEHSVDLIYHKVMQRRKEDCSRPQQLGVTCLAAYAAGAVGTVISNPADNIVSSLYNKKADNVMQAVKNIGLVNLFTRSLPVRITLVGPVVTLQWFFYDTIKVLCGLPSSGGLTRRLEEANLSA